MNEAIILAVDDQEEMLSAYKNIFSGPQSPAPNRLFDGPQSHEEAPAARKNFTLVTANQGEEAVRIVEALHRENRPIQAVFLDVQMPPGIDGLETAKRMRAIDSELQIVICTAYSEHPFENFIEQLGRPDHLYYLEKPFSPDEVLQLAHSLAGQWSRRQEMSQVMSHLRRNAEKTVNEAFSGKTHTGSLQNLCLEFNDLTGALSSSLVREERSGALKFLYGCGLLESDQDISRARNNRLPLKIFRIATGDVESSLGRLAVLLLQPNQSDFFCRQVVEAYKPVMITFAREMENKPGPESNASASSPESAAGGEGLSPLKEFHGILSGDPGMQRLWEQIARVALQDVPVFISGETGAGKELVAQAMHRESPRSTHTFVALNCANLSETMLESQLFGHHKGAFTGAVRDQPGLLSEADGGTLFLDEVAEIPLPIQAKLLRVLQEREYLPLGATKPVRFDTLIVSASHSPLRQAVQEGRFREDLFYRLHVIPLELPPLRDRGGDAVLLFQHFLQAELAKKKAGSKLPAIGPDVLTVIRLHEWPGNVRELQNFCAYIAAMSDGDRITLDHLPRELREAVVNAGGGEFAVPGAGSQLTIPSSGPSGSIAGHPETFARPSQLNRDTILAALERCGGNRSEVARQFGVSRMTLWRHMKAEGI